MSQAQLSTMIAFGARALGVELSPAVAAKLADYLALIARWNRVYNLTAVRDPDGMVTRHLLDSLAVLPHLEATRLADLGSGAGLPGIPIAICRPALPVTLVESNGKKARFLRTVARELALDQVTVVESRIEAWRPEPPPDAVIARALASVVDLTRLVDPWMAPDACFYAMKGPGHEAELAALPGSWTCLAVHPLTVPGLDADRVLVVLKRVPTGSPGGPRTAS